jgi:signal transduction histidine kinase
METAEARKLTISAERREGEVLFVVEDTGSGIPEALRPRLFETFQSAKTGGMGVGLSISRTIVEAHSGRLWLERSSGSGARFCFTVPAEVASA